MMKDNNYIQYLDAGKTQTIADKYSEAGAKMYVKAKNRLAIVNVDHGLMKLCHTIKKCDFIVVGVESETTHMVELKGSNVEDAFSQIESTIDYFVGKENGEYKQWFINRRIMDAYIVSPDRQKVPKLHSMEEKRLAKRLAMACAKKPDDMFQLIYFVKNIKEQRKISRNGRQILSSGRAPVELE